jgi:hypothetical protein
MRLSDAGLRCRQTKLIYPNHRLTPWFIEAAGTAIARTEYKGVPRSRSGYHRAASSAKIEFACSI